MVIAATPGLPERVRLGVRRSQVTEDKVDWSLPLITGIEVPVDVAALVTRVRLSPVSASWYREVVESVIAKYGIEFEVTQSDLAGEPFF